jgi:hypothetical protein
MNSTSIKTLEDATFRSTVPYLDRVVQTNDMLDFAVEHLSQYFRNFHFPHNFQQKQDAYNKCMESLRSYTKRVFSTTSPYNTLNSYTNDKATIAVIPFGSVGNKYSNESTFDPYYELTIQSLIATLASIWQTGTVGRIVIVGGPTQQERDSVTQIINTFEDMVNDYCNEINDETKRIQFQYIGNRENTKNLPKEALNGLQNAFNGNLPDDEITLWLGPTTDRTKWKYVYFTEPDLILHTRPSTIPILLDGLDNNRILAAHRFQLVQHESDFLPNTTLHESLYMSAVGKFGIVHELDSITGNDQCIWTTNDTAYFGRRPRPCGDFWYRCGFGDQYNSSIDRNNITEVEQSYIGYQPLELIRLTHGTGFVIATGTESRQICTPTRKQQQIA